MGVGPVGAVGEPADDAGLREATDGISTGVGAGDVGVIGGAVIGRELRKVRAWGLVGVEQVGQAGDEPGHLPAGHGVAGRVGGGGGPFGESGGDEAQDDLTGGGGLGAEVGEGVGARRDRRRIHRPRWDPPAGAARSRPARCRPARRRTRRAGRTRRRRRASRGGGGGGRSRWGSPVQRFRARSGTGRRETPPVRDVRTPAPGGIVRPAPLLLRRGRWLLPTRSSPNPATSAENDRSPGLRRDRGSSTPFR